MTNNEIEKNLLEDIELAKKYGEHIKEIEENANATTYHIKKPEDVFKLL